MAQGLVVLTKEVLWVWSAHYLLTAKIKPAQRQRTGCTAGENGGGETEGSSWSEGD